MIMGVTDRIQAKNKRLDVLIKWTALSPTHIQFLLVFSGADNNLGGEHGGGARPGFRFLLNS